MAFWDKEKELVKVDKVGTKSSFYSFKRVEKNGRTFLDVREHFSKADGSVQHTTKGMSIPMNMVTDIMVGFRDVVDILQNENTKENV